MNNTTKLLLTAIVIAFTLTPASAARERERRSIFKKSNENVEQVESKPVINVDTISSNVRKPQVVEPTVIVQDTTITLNYTSSQIDSLIAKWSELMAYENFDNYFEDRKSVV